MQHALFDEIARFKKWAGLHSEASVAEDDRGGEWECDYTNWSAIWTSFSDFISNTYPDAWSDKQIEALLYIIARDNDTESLAGIAATNPKALVLLATRAVTNAPPNAKWQLAVQLETLADKQLAEKLLKKFVQDKEEYVSRRALMCLAAIHSTQTEHYCKIAWEKDIGSMQKYQRIAVLHSLFKIKSPLLNHYLTLARADGRENLLNNVQMITGQMESN
jgi:hypothetical protein